MPSDLWSCVRRSTGQKRGNALKTLTWAAGGNLGFHTAACAVSHLQTVQTSGFTWDTGMGRSGYWCTEHLGAPDLAETVREVLSLRHCFHFIFDAGSQELFEQ